MKTCRYLIAAAIFIASAVQTHAQNQSYEVTGALVNEDGAPIAQHRVLLYNDTDVLIAEDTTDSEGKFTLSYQVTTVSLNPNDNPDIPGEFKLGSSYPNPFNPKTTIPFQAPRDANVTISLYNIIGQEIMRTNRDVTRGTHEILVNLGGRISQGQYILRVYGDGFSLTQNMTYVSIGQISGSAGIELRSGGRVSSRKTDNVSLSSEAAFFKIIVEESDDYSGLEIQVPANQNYEVNLLELAKKVQKPQLSTLQATDITLTAARSGGTITDDGGSEITEMGVVWAASENPTLSSYDGITSDSLGDGVFNSQLSGLLPETIYFLRAYATNSAGTSYGESFEFITPTVEEIKDGVDEIVTRLLSVDVVPFFTEELESVPEKDRAVYLDSLDATLKSLFIAVNEHFSEDEFKAAFENALNTNSENSEKTLPNQIASLCRNDLRLAVARGVSVDISLTSVIASGLAGGVTGRGGGGVEVIYDLLHMDRNVYVFRMCGIGTPIAGVGGQWSVGPNLALFYRLITNVQPGQKDKINRFDGTTRGANLNLRVGMHGKFGFEAGLTFGYGQEINHLTFDNFSLCPTSNFNPRMNRGLTEYSFDVSGGIGVGAGILAVIGGELFASTRQSKDYYYNNYEDGLFGGRISRSTRMALDMVTPTIANGITGSFPPNPVDFTIAATTLVYGLFNPNDCPPPQFLPDVRTLESNSLTQNSAVISATIADDGDSPVTERGICWSETNDPDSFTNCTNEGTGMGEFSSTISGLQSDKQYYARAFAGNSVGTAFGDRISFITRYVSEKKFVYSETFNTDPGFDINFSSNTEGKADIFWDSITENFFASVKDQSSSWFSVGISPVFDKVIDPRVMDFSISFRFNPVKPDWGHYPGIYFIKSEDSASPDNLQRALQFSINWSDHVYKKFKVGGHDGDVYNRYESPSIPQQDEWYDVNITYNSNEKNLSLRIEREDGSVFVNENTLDIPITNEFDQLLIGEIQGPTKYGNEARIRIDNIYVDIKL